MSGEEESNDQMEAQDTNDNSVSKSEFYFEASRNYNKKFFLHNLEKKNIRTNLRRKARIKRPTWTTIAARDLISCWSKPRSSRTLCQARRRLRPRRRKSLEERRKWKWRRRRRNRIRPSIQLSKRIFTISYDRNWTSNFVAVIVIAKPNKRKMRNCWLRPLKQKRFSASKHRHTTSPEAKCETIKFAASTGWFPCMRMASTES